MADPDDDLRATTESIAQDVERLKRIEIDKRAMGVSNPETERLSHEAEALAQRIAGMATAERELVEEAVAGEEPSGAA